MRHSTATFKVATSGMLHQNAPHQLGRNREEMRAILPLHAFIVHQPHICFIDQGGGLQAVAGALALHVAARQAVELVINDGRHLLKRLLVSVTPCAKQHAYVVRSRLTGLCRLLHSL